MGRGRGSRAFWMQSFAIGFCPNTSFLGVGRMVLILMGKKPSQIVHYLYLFDQRSFIDLLSFGFLVWAGCGDDCFLLSDRTDSEKTGRNVSWKCLCYLIKQFRVLDGWRQNNVHSAVRHTWSGSETNNLHPFCQSTESFIAFYWC